MDVAAVVDVALKFQKSRKHVQLLLELLNIGSRGWCWSRKCVLEVLSLLECVKQLSLLNVYGG